MNLKTTERNGVDPELGRDNEEDHKADEVEIIETALRIELTVREGCWLSIYYNTYGWKYKWFHTPQRVQGVRVETNLLAVAITSTSP